MPQRPNHGKVREFRELFTKHGDGAVTDNNVFNVFSNRRYLALPGGLHWVTVATYDDPVSGLSDCMTVV